MRGKLPKEEDRGKVISQIRVKPILNLGMIFCRQPWPVCLRPCPTGSRPPLPFPPSRMCHLLKCQVLPENQILNIAPTPGFLPTTPSMKSTSVKLPAGCLRRETRGELQGRCLISSLSILPKLRRKWGKGTKASKSRTLFYTHQRFLQGFLSKCILENGIYSQCPPNGKHFHDFTYFQDISKNERPEP